MKQASQVDTEDRHKRTHSLSLTSSDALIAPFHQGSFFLTDAAMAAQVRKCGRTSAEYTDESKRACKKHSLSSMGTSGAAEHVCVESIASSSCEASGAAEQRCVDANSEYEINAMRMLDSRIALALAMACSATGPQKPSSGAI